MDLSNNQVELTRADAKPNKPAGLGFGLHSEGNKDKPIYLSASSTPVPSTNILGALKCLVMQEISNGLPSAH